MESFDPRGGSNRYKFRTNFFKNWSNEMAYVLGFLYADGNITDAASSSRTQYIKFSNSEKKILEKIRAVLKAEHPIRVRPPRKTLHVGGKTYISLEQFFLRIGSRRMFTDLKKLGLVPNKSKVMKFPLVPSKYLSHFIRGYFDGDGTIYIEEKKGVEQNMILKRARIIFSSGSKAFLSDFADILAKTLDVRRAKLYDGNRCFQIVYSIKESVEIFKFIYNKAYGLFMKRKFDTFKRFFNIKIKWLDSGVVKILNENKNHLAWYPRS